VDDIPDGGKIIAQILHPNIAVSENTEKDIAILHELSHLQVVYLTLVYIEMMINKSA
jgi:hypothetical protein